MFIFKSPFEGGPNPFNKRLVKSAGSSQRASPIAIPNGISSLKPTPSSNHEEKSCSKIGPVCPHCNNKNALVPLRRRKPNSPRISKPRSKSAIVSRREKKITIKKEFEPIALQVVDFSRLTIPPFSPKNQSQGEKIIKQEKDKNFVISEQKSILKQASKKTNKNVSVSFSDFNETFEFSELWARIERITLQANLTDSFLRDHSKQKLQSRKLITTHKRKPPEPAFKVIQYGNPSLNNLHIKAEALSKPTSSKVPDNVSSFSNFKRNQNLQRYNSPRETILTLS